MSTALGIAGVSVVLVDLLNNGLVDHDVGATVGGSVTVSALPPDRVAPANGGADTTQLNLFLFNVTPNAAWRNIGQPRFNDRGERVGNPPLALNLHYLLTAYGAKDFYAEILLGWAMQLFHEHPVLTRAEVARALAPPAADVPSTLPDSLKDLSKSGLADQVELIKIAPQPLSTDEMSKLWTAFQTHYRSAAAYEASVVLIDSQASTKSQLRVRERNVYAHPLLRPVVDSIVSSLGEASPIHAGDTILVRGSQLGADATRVRIRDAVVTLDPADVTDTELRVSLAGHDLPAGLQPLQVIHTESMGTPAADHRGVESNLTSFVLTPVITEPLSVAGGTLTIETTPGLKAGQKIVLLLNQLLASPSDDDSAAAYSAELPPLEADAASVDFPLTGLTAGTYLVRVRVDGAESTLAVDPATDRYDAPQVTVP